MYCTVTLYKVVITLSAWAQWYLSTSKKIMLCSEPENQSTQLPECKVQTLNSCPCPNSGVGTWKKVFTLVSIKNHTLRQCSDTKCKPSLSWNINNRLVSMPNSLFELITSFCRLIPLYLGSLVFIPYVIYKHMLEEVLNYPSQDSHISILLAICKSLLSLN